MKINAQYILCVGFSLFFSPLIAVAQTSDAEVFKLYLAGADKGDARAQYLLSCMYEKGQGVEKNIDQSAKWLFSACEGGDADALKKIGDVCYRVKDYKQAFKWYLKLANQGNAEAQSLLGQMYSNGLGVVEDRVEAAKWHRKAAEQGIVLSQVALGASYTTGGGGEVNYPEAEKWLLKAAIQGGSIQGDSNVRYFLGQLYADPRWKVDYVSAAKWFLAAAEDGHPMSQALIGQMYLNGQGVEKDISKSIKWYLRAAKQGNDFGQMNLGAAYEQGEGVPQDYVNAYKWMNLASASSNKDLAEFARIHRGHLLKVMTEEQVAEAQRLSREFVPSAEISN